jgi:hypothetical protein
VFIGFAQSTALIYFLLSFLIARQEAVNIKEAVYCCPRFAPIGVLKVKILIFRMNQLNCLNQAPFGLSILQTVKLAWQCQVVSRRIIFERGAGAEVMCQRLRN